MTYIYHVLRDGPIGLWSFDSIPLTDSSGYGHDATYTGSPSTTRPIVAGGVSAQQLDSSDSILYDIDAIMSEGKESRAFSLEAWVKPKSGNTSIISRDNSGLFIDGLKLRFSLEFTDLVSIEYQHLKAGDVYHVVATYDGHSMMMYLNGQMVSSTELDDVNISGGFADTNANLKTNTDTILVIDTPSVYNFSLQNSAILRHYSYGSSYPEIVNLSLINGGKYYQFADAQASIYESSLFGKVDDWNLGLMTDTVSVIDGKLVNLQSDDTTTYLEGTWSYQYSVSSDDGTGTILNGSRISWEAVGGIVVEISTDDVTWTPVSSGDSIVGVKDLADGFNVSVRVTLPTGSTQSVVDYLSLVFYVSKDIRGSDEDLPAVFNNPLDVTLSESTYPPAGFSDNAGVDLPDGTGFTIGADTEFGGYYAVEMTVFFPSNSNSKTVLYVDTPSAQPSITTNGSGQWVSGNLTALYIDGVSVASTFSVEPGKWHHVLAVFAESEANVTVGNDLSGTDGYPMRVGYLALYSDPIDANMAEAIYDVWVGTPAIQIKESNVINVSEKTFTETGSPFRAYTFDWSITGAG